MINEYFGAPHIAFQYRGNWPIKLPVLLTYNLLVKGFNSIEPTIRTSANADANHGFNKGKKP